MDTFYSSLSNEGDELQNPYFLVQKLASYQSSELPDDKMSLKQPSVTLAYPNLFSGSSISTHDHDEAKSIRSRDEMVFIPPIGVTSSMQQMDGQQLHFMPRFSDGDTLMTDTQFFPKQPLQVHNSEQNPQYHGLSLSLGSQLPSLVQLPSDLNQYTNSSLSPTLSSSAVYSEAHVSQLNGLKNVEYLSFDLAGGSRNTVKYGSVNNVQPLISPKEIDSRLSPHESPGITGTFCNSRYLKAVQDLLGDVVNIHRAPKRSEQCQNFNSLGLDGSSGTDAKGDGMSSEPCELTANASCELSPSERHDLQDKMTKLLTMLDEVDRRYKQYYHQMQGLVSTFEMVAGCGAAQPYTTLALRTISRQFRCLRDAIKRKIQAIQKSLGEQDVTSNGQATLSRLRFVDQQLRQRKSLPHFGIMGQPWRPQRGLPENAVSVLRSWLFEHFLHPYPKDSEKIILARQAGLSRSQVANWFINARVRLWKPMIEEMYKEEFGDAEEETKTLPEHAVTAQEKSAFNDREEELQGSSMSAAVDENHLAQSSEFRPDFISSSEWSTHAAKLGYQNGLYQGNEVNFGLLEESHHNKILNMAGHSIFSDEMLSPNKIGDGGVVMAADKQDVSMLGNMMGNQVSLALGLQHCDTNPQLISGGTQPREDAATSSTGLDKLEYHYMDAVDQQHRFTNPHLLSDFVA